MVYQFRLAHKLLRDAEMDRDVDLILERLEGQSLSTSRSAILA
jgi:hypothetical protein